MSDFEKDFESDVGISPAMLRYRVEELEDRICTIERMLESRDPVIAAAALRMEALISDLNKRNIIDIDIINNIADKNIKKLI